MMQKSVKVCYKDTFDQKGMFTLFTFCCFGILHVESSIYFQIFCEQENSDLVTLSGQDEHQFIVDALGELDKYPGMYIQKP